MSLSNSLKWTEMEQALHTYSKIKYNLQTW